MDIVNTGLDWTGQTEKAGSRFTLGLCSVFNADCSVPSKIDCRLLKRAFLE
jgi:hypothetical protein